MARRASLVCVCRVVRFIEALIVCLIMALCPLSVTPSFGTMCLAPRSQVNRDAMEMVVEAMIIQAWARLQQGEITPDALWDVLSESLAQVPQEIRAEIEIDRGLPVKAVEQPDGTWNIDAMLWVREKPLRVICSGGECSFQKAKLPLLMDRVIARGGRVLEREIPPGPVRILVDLCRENGLHDLMVYGGAVRNILLERETIKGDTDIFIWTRLTTEEKAYAHARRKPLHEMRDEKEQQILARLRELFGRDPKKVVLDGSPLHFIGIIDEENVCYAAFARGFVQPVQEIPGINVDNIGIHLDSLETYDPVHGLRDLSKGVLRFCGTDLEGYRGINYREALRILRLESQLAPWGVKMEERSERILQRIFVEPAPDITRMLVEWAERVAALKDFYPELESDVLEIRGFREKATKENLSEEEGRRLAQAFDRLTRHVIAYDLISAGREPSLTQEQFDRAKRAAQPEIDSIIRNSCVGIDLITGTTKNDTYEIGYFIVQLYQGAEDPYAITARLRQIGLEPVLKALGIHLDPFTRYARRIWAEDRIKDIRFDMPVRVGQRMAAYPMGQRIVKIPLHTAHEPDLQPERDSYAASLSSHEIAQERLGGLIPPTTILKNVRIPKAHVANVRAFVSQVQANDLGDEIKLPLVIAQDMPGMNLKDRTVELKKKGDMDGLRRLMKNFVYFQVQLWKRGVINSDYRLESYRVNEDGEILLFNLSKLSVIDPQQDYSHHILALRQFLVGYFNHLSPGLGTRFSSLSDWFIRDSELRKAFAEREIVVPAEDAHWPRQQVDRLPRLDSAMGSSL